MLIEYLKFNIFPDFVKSELISKILLFTKIEK